MGSQRRQIQRKNGSSPQKSGERSAGAEKPVRSKSKSSPRFSGREADSLSDFPLTPGDMLYLQRTVGNRAVNRLIQAKLKSGQPGDEYEQEADLVAEQVPRMPEEETANASQAAGGQIQRNAPKPEETLQRQAMPEEEQHKQPDEASMVQMKPVSSAVPVQQKLIAEEEQRKRPENVGMVQMKEAADAGSTHGQAMSPEEEGRRKLMEEGQSVYANEEAGETPSASPDVESQIESMRRRLIVG
jgi:hypothetical protein